MGTVRPLSSTERDYAAWLGDVEYRVVIPLKWGLLLLVAIFWMWARDWVAPAPMVFGLFYVFAALTAAEHYFFARDRVTPRQVRAVVLVSFVLDLVFVCGLVGLDLVDSTTTHGEFFPLFLLSVLRGFALYRSRWENLAGFMAVSVPFLVLAWLKVESVPFLELAVALRSLGLTWGMMLLVQVFIGLVNAQREELLRSSERQVRSQSLASLGELAAGVAHEINNPIGIIKTYADYLEKSTPSDDPRREDFEAIRDEAGRCQEIVRRMLDFSNPQVQGFVSVDLGGLVRETVGFVFLEGREGAPEVTVEEQPGVPAVRADPVQMKQALINILINARQVLEDHGASEEAGTDFQGRIEIEISRGSGPRPPVRVAVRDNGPGIDPREAERIFEPFFTRRRKGTGLGLAITRRIIEAHSGTIRIAPQMAGGTVVTFEIPIEGEETD
jgi:signal transduction histidine kinase